jgi:hypothetical protein
MSDDRQALQTLARRWRWEDEHDKRLDTHLIAWQAVIVARRIYCRSRSPLGRSLAYQELNLWKERLLER